MVCLLLELCKDKEVDVGSLVENREKAVYHEQHEQAEWGLRLAGLEMHLYGLSKGQFLILVVSKSTLLVRYKTGSYPGVHPGLPILTSLSCFLSS